MKKITNLLSMVLLMLCMGLTSCDDVLSMFDQPVENPNPLAKQVSGMWWSLADQEGTYKDATDSYPYTRMGQAICFNEDGTGYGVTFFFNDDQGDPIAIIGGDGLATFTYTSTADGRLSLNFTDAYKDYADYFKKWTMTYASEAVTATNGTLTLTLEKPSDAIAVMIHQWDEQFNGGAEVAPYHNINDADFTADTWRKQGAIYIWDGSTQLTEDNWQDKKNYKSVDLPWSGTSDLLTNLPYGFCNNITPENGWEWVLNRCGGSKIPNNNFFAVYNKYSGILRFFFYMPKTTKTAGNDHIWQVSLTNTLADNSMWGYGLPSAETAKDRTKLSATSTGTQIDYVAPWVEMKSTDGLIVPNEGWWAFDVDLSQYRPNHDISNESIRLQMRAWNDTHVSLYSTLTADINGSIKQTIKDAGSGSTVAKGICIGVSAAVGIASTVAGIYSGNAQGVCAGLGSLASAFGKGAEMAGLFDDGGKPFEAQVSLGMNGKIDTDGFIKGSSSVFDVPSPTLQMKDFYLSNSHLGQGVWNIKRHPVVHVFKDAKYYIYAESKGQLTKTVDYACNVFPYFFDPSSIEVELNSNVFPSDQIEWMQVDATCIATKDMQEDGTDPYRTALGLQPRSRGESESDIKIMFCNYNNLVAKDSYLIDALRSNDSWIPFFDYLGYYANRAQAEKEKNPMYYPIKLGDYWRTGRQIGRGQSDDFAIEPLCYIEDYNTPYTYLSDWFSTGNTTVKEKAKIWLPSLEVNVFVTVKMKGIAEPFVFSRNYLPEFKDAKFNDMDALVTSIKSHKLSSKQSGHDATYKYQVERIEKLFKDMKAKFE